MARRSDVSRRSAAALAWALGAIVAAGGVTRADVIDRLVAIVGDRLITLSDVRAAVEFGFVPRPAGPGADAATVASLVDRTLVSIEVERYGPGTTDDAAIERRIVEIETRLGESGFSAAMARAGLDTPRLRALVREDLGIERYLAERFAAAAQPTDDEVLRHYQENPAAFSRDGRERPFVEVESEVRAALSDARRKTLIDEWIVSLRNRARYTVLWPPAEPGPSGR